jgi:hypothetical protein
MKEAGVDKNIIIIFDDVSKRIPHKGTQICLDFKDIEYIYNESKKALNREELTFE